MYLLFLLFEILDHIVRCLQADVVYLALLPFHFLLLEILFLKPQNCPVCDSISEWHSSQSFISLSKLFFSSGLVLCLLLYVAALQVANSMYQLILLVSVL